MVGEVYTDVPYNPDSAEYKIAQEMLRVAHDKNEQAKLAQVQQEENQKLALRAKMSEALGLGNPENMADLAMSLTPGGKLKSAVTAASETTLGKALAEVASHYKENVVEAAKGFGEAFKDMAPKSLNDLAHLMFTPQNPSAERMAHFAKVAETGDMNRVVTNQLGAVPYGWAGLAGTAVVGAGVATYKSENEKLAESFQRAHDNGFTREKTFNNMNTLKESGTPEMKSAVDLYLKLYEHLEKDGEFSKQNGATMRAVAHNITEKLKAGEPVVALGPRAGVDVSVDQELALVK